MVPPSDDGIKADVPDVVAPLPKAAPGEASGVSSTQVLVQTTNMDTSGSGPAVQARGPVPVPITMPSLLVETNASVTVGNLYRDRVLAWANTDTSETTAPTNMMSAQQLIVNNNTNRERGTVVDDNPIEPILDVKNESEHREEIEVELVSMNGQPFRGSITKLEAKHGIYRDCLGFKDFTNFDGVRLLFKGTYSATFKLKEQINVDEWYEKRLFDFNRRTKVNGKLEIVTIKCRIKGLQSMDSRIHNRIEKMDANLTKVFIEGCEYRVPEKTIVEALSNWGELATDLKEELFHDPHDSEGTNRTSNYSVMMKINGNIPQLLPLWGKRVKIYYKGINKLCTCCFEKHQRSTCKNEKVNWMEYVANFAEQHPDLDKTFFGNWWKQVENKTKETQNTAEKPMPDWFGVPKSNDHFNELMVELMKTGMPFSLAEKEIEERHNKYKSAIDQYNQGK